MWSQWVRKPVTEEKRTFTNFVKETQNGKSSEMLELFNRKLDGLAKHHFNWLHQAKECRALKDSLRDDEIVGRAGFQLWRKQKAGHCTLLCCLLLRWSAILCHYLWVPPA